MQPFKVADKEHPDPARFIRDNTDVQAPRLLPELRLHLASEMMPLWHATEDELADRGIPPPYWAFAWAGGQALTRFVLDNPAYVRGRRVLDFAAGSGMGAVGAMRAGAATATATDLDPFACAAVAINAEANDVAVTVERRDVIGIMDGPWDLVMAGDVCYEEPMAGRVGAWLIELAEAGMPVLMGDPGRAYRPTHGLERLARYQVQTTVELEDSDLRSASVWRVGG